MAIDFPNSPTVGQSFTVGNRTWIWDGTAWELSIVSAIPNTILDAKGDLIVGTAADTAGRLPVGADGFVLSAQSSETEGLEWVDPTSQNVVINGAMQVSQRGTSKTGITASGFYTADRWQFTTVNIGTFTQTIENDAPTGSGLRKSLKILCTTADTSPSAADALNIQHRLEGQNCQSFRKGTTNALSFAISFWVKSNVTGTYICELFDNDNSRQVSASYTISSSATWEKKTIIFPADTTGAFDNNDEQSLRIEFWLGAGSDFTSGTLNTVWNSSTTANRVVGQTNLAAATNNYWQITGVQLQPGSVATPFQFEDYSTTLAKCQRYYYRSTGGGIYGAHSTAAGAASTTSTRSIIRHPVTMRSAPQTLDYLGVVAYDSVNILTPSAISIDAGLTTPDYSTISCTVTGATQFRPYFIISDNDSTDYIGVSAEL